MQPTGCVSNQHIDLTRAGRFQSIEQDRCTIRTSVLGNHGYIIAFTPHLQLLYCCGPEGVASSKHD